MVRTAFPNSQFGVVPLLVHYQVELYTIQWGQSGQICVNDNVMELVKRLDTKNAENGYPRIEILRRSSLWAMGMQHVETDYPEEFVHVNGDLLAVANSYDLTNVLEEEIITGSDERH